MSNSQRPDHRPAAAASEQKPAQAAADGESGGSAAPAGPPVRQRSRYWLPLTVLLLVLLVLAVVLAPWWGRPVLKNAIKSALLEDGWQTVEMEVTSLGISQAKLGGIVLDRKEAQLEIPEMSLTYSLRELVFKKRVQGVIASRPKLQARFAKEPLTLLISPLAADWPKTDRLSFDRIYISDAEIIPQPSSGLKSISLNAMLEHTAPRGRKGGTARVWASAQSLWPYAQIDISADADLKAQTIKATLDAEFRDLNQWREMPLPPEAHQAIGLMREKVTLQGAASVTQRTVSNWMLMGKTPAAVYTAPGGTHIEALEVDFGVNVLGTDSLNYGWLRSASGAAQAAEGSMEWNNLWAEIKPGEFLNAHVAQASLRAEVSNIARELMPAVRVNTELTNLWRKQAWQARDLSLNFFAPDTEKSRPPFVRLSGNLKLGPFDYPWEKFIQLSPQSQLNLSRFPLLDTLVETQVQQQAPASTSN